MAVLDAAGRGRVLAQAQRQLPVDLRPWPAGVTKAVLAQVVAYTDDWIDSGAGATAPATGYNAGLPAAWRTGASLGQKTWLFCLVAMRRAGLLRAEED